MECNKILFVITDLDYGGAERQLVLLATRLVKRGWRIKVVSILPPRAFVEELKHAGISVETLGITHKWQFIRAWWRLRRIINDWKPQTVHSFMIHANLLARIVRLNNKRYRLICSIRSFNEGGRFREHLYRLTDGLADVTTHVSSLGVEKYIRIKAVSPQKIIYFPNGIDPAPFFTISEKKEFLRKKMGITDDDFLWLAAGRLVEAKDYPTLLKAFSMLKNEFTNATLWIAGNGPLRRELERLSSELKLEKRVSFLGLRKNVPELMAAADAFVLSSAWEGMPNVLLEASASALPIVSTRVSGAEEIVENGKTGYLVAPQNPAALAKAMAKLMELSPDERKTMGQRARKKILQEFHIDAIVDKWEHLYHKITEKKSKWKTS